MVVLKDGAGDAVPLDRASNDHAPSRHLHRDLRAVGRGASRDGDALPRALKGGLSGRVDVEDKARARRGALPVAGGPRPRVEASSVFGARTVFKLLHFADMNVAFRDRLHHDPVGVLAKIQRGVLRHGREVPLEVVAAFGEAEPRHPEELELPLLPRRLEIVRPEDHVVAVHLDGAEHVRMHVGEEVRPEGPAVKDGVRVHHGADRALGVEAEQLCVVVVQIVPQVPVARVDAADGPSPRDHDQQVRRFRVARGQVVLTGERLREHPRDGREAHVVDRGIVDQEAVGLERLEKAAVTEGKRLGLIPNRPLAGCGHSRCARSTRRP